MERTPTIKEILRIGLPLMIGSISESISAIVDTAFMGHIGTLAMDGMGMTNTILLMLIMVGWSFSRSIQILVSQNFGAKNYENIGSILSNALALLIPIGFLLFIALYLFNLPVLGMIIKHSDIRDIASEICQIRSWGMPFIMTSLAISSFFTGIGRTKILIYSQGAAALSNIVLNYLLVFGKYGMPVLGYRGSALATVISEGIGLAVLFIYLYLHRDIVREFYLFKKFQLVRVHIKEIFRLATPMFLQHSVSLGSWVLFFSLIEKMGHRELAISMILKQIFSAITIPGFCLANTSNTLVGQLVGARKIDLIIPTIRKVVLINYLILVSLAILAYIFRFPIVSLFTIDTAVIEGISYPLLALVFAYLFIPSANVLFNSISALGNTRIPLMIESIVIATYLGYMYLFIYLGQGNLVIAWLSETQYWFFLLIMGIMYFKFYPWRKHIVYLDEQPSNLTQ